MFVSRTFVVILVVLLGYGIGVLDCSAESAAPNVWDVQARVVFSYDGSRCQDLDVPDAPMRAFRRSDGKVIARASNFVNFEYVGLSLDAVKKDCNVVYQGSKDPNPAHFNYLTWIISTWTADGKNVVALGHNEFHGNEIRGACSRTGLRPCWYNSIVLLASRDGGATFQRAAGQTNGAVIAPSFTNVQGEGEPRGFFNPSNMFRRGDYVYSIVGYNGLTKAAHGRCLARASDPFDVNSWELYRNGVYIKPSQHPFAPPDAEPDDCSILEGLEGVVGSISRIRGSDWYVAVSMSATSDGGGKVELFFSKDLIKWGNATTILHLPTFWSKNCQGGYRYNYPSLMDPLGDMNFSDVGDDAELYLTRAACQITLDRDLVAIKVPIKQPFEKP
jgi:hypothetical protein